MTNGGSTGWQGLIGDLGLYKELRAKGDPSPLLRIADSWLRKELDERRAKASAEGQTVEEAAGPAALAEKDPLQVGHVSGGGFSNGRMAAYDFVG